MKAEGIAASYMLVFLVVHACISLSVLEDLCSASKDVCT
jgi:hypothetical protein